jgi:signal transduction histidine kinase
MAKMRVRARAVDMLGRQQIAGIPTAIHELFKNAHDAYAQSVKVDYFRSDALLVIRDDGLGMTREDFEGRWLTLGTESKVGANSQDSQAWTGPRGEARRIIMGEKGIGRLAIAAMGPQVLVLTRAVRPDGLSGTVMALVNWRFFEVPGLDLDGIELPVMELPRDELPDRTALGLLTEAVAANVEYLGERLPAEQAAAIKADLAMMDFDPSTLQAAFTEPRLGPGLHGTQFFIRPASTVLSDDIDDGSDDKASPLEKMLLGFSNTMLPDREAPPIRTEFRDHLEDGRRREPIGGDTFFTPDEFRAADHHIQGTFDEFGQFDGTVSVYMGEPIRHTIHWNRSTGRPTDCGPFSIRFAYVQGVAVDSKVPTQEWASISRKLNRIGGLYVYKDGIRVLPYGNSDFDFLGIERRRTKSAQDWFFSYRRIFGAVEIGHESNPNLVEKAGREGFRTNRALKELVSILENFFERLAIDFFRPTSQYGTSFNTVKSELQAEAKILERRERGLVAKRRRFAEQLDRFFGAVERSEPTLEAERLLEDLRTRAAALATMGGTEAAAQMLIDLEIEMRRRGSELRRRFAVSKPKEHGMSKAQQKDWAAYQRNATKLDEEVFRPMERAMDELVGAVAANSITSVTRRRRVVANLEAKKRAATADSARLRRQVDTQVVELSKTVTGTIRESITKLSDDIERTFADFGRTDTGAVGADEVRALQIAWEGRIDSSGAATRERFEALRDQLEELTKAVGSGEYANEATAALENQAEGYKSQLEDYTELAQIGMALGIVQHEFDSTATSLSNAISRLQPWGDRNPQLGGLVAELRASFEHLEGYLRLFTPISRRLNPEPIDLTGEQIRLYLEEVFGDRMRRHSVELRRTRAFESMRVRGRPSTFLPAFVNVVDNAIYWIAFEGSSERWVALDADDHGFLVSNGGPGIDRRIAERIFEFGETTKAGGRGMGLYISRQALARERYGLTLETEGLGTHPTFRIGPLLDEDGAEVK